MEVGENAHGGHLAEAPQKRGTWKTAKKTAKKQMTAFS